MSLGNGPAKLREQLGGDDLLVVPGAFNALSAVMIERAGFGAVYATGAGLANAHLAMPDLGLMTADELVATVRNMRRVTTIPTIVDIDTGFGGVHNVARVVADLADLGVAAVQIEDQVMPKRCGHFEGKAVVPVEEMLAKVNAALDARHDLLVIARTDAIAVEGVDAAIERARLYAAAGADLVFVEAMESVEQIERVGREVPGPKLINMVEGGRTPLLEPAQIRELGYSIALYANFALRVMMRALPEQLARLAQARTSIAMVDEIASWQERQDLVGLEQHSARERRWAERAQELLGEATVGAAMQRRDSDED